MIKRLNWDSECFGYEVGTTFLGTSPFGYDEFIEESKGYRLVYVFSKIELAHLPFGLKKVDEKITLVNSLQPPLTGHQRHRETIKGQSPIGTIFGLDEVEFRLETVNNFNQAFIDLALISGEYSRFKIDERLRNREYEKLYRFWAWKALEKDDKGFVFVKDGEVQGMITFTPPLDGITKISLLAVRPNSRNWGIGSALLNRVLASGQASGGSALSVTTQRRNIAAMLLYQKAGFEIVDNCTVYHWWRG